MKIHSNSLPAPDCSSCTVRNSRLFCDFTTTPLHEFNGIGTTIDRPKGSILFRQGFNGDRIFFLCRGRVKLSCGSPDGKLLNLRIANAGDVLGLSAVLAESTYEVTAEAMETCTVKVISRANFLAFLSHQGEASLHAAVAMSRDYNSALALARSLALCPSISGRVARLLLDWGRDASEGNLNAPFNLAVTHEEIAGFTASSRETITRILGQFQKDKLICIHGTSVQILQPKELEALAS